MNMVPRRQVDDLIEAITASLETHLTTSPGLARVLGVLDAVQDGASITTVTEALARIQGGDSGE